MFQGVEIWLASAQFADSQVSTPSFSLYVWAVRDPGSPKLAQVGAASGDLNSSKMGVEPKNRGWV